MVWRLKLQGLFQTISQAQPFKANYFLFKAGMTYVRNLLNFGLF